MINIFDMMGPVMIGPSSSHTAGAARIGNMGRTLLGEEVARADIGLHGSFAETGFGHGTDRALLAGLLGMKPDDLRIPSEMICIFPYFCPYAESVREIREIFV